jgi:hypothetical protein
VAVAGADGLGPVCVARVRSTRLLPDPGRAGTDGREVVVGLEVVVVTGLVGTVVLLFD